MKAIAGLFLTLTLAGCAAQYGEYSFWTDSGFTETELQPNLFNVRFRGNEFTTLERASDFSMLRAAEICSERGLQYMEISHVSSQEREERYVPPTANTTITTTTTGNITTQNATTSFEPSYIMYTPEAGLTALCVAEASETTWDAMFLQRSLKTKYDIQS